MRALLVVNEHASGVTQRIVAEVRHHLERDLDLDIVHTVGRGHATQIVREGSPEYGAVIALGGDGTVNEVATGLLAADSTAVLGALPGGHANVIARNLGMPRDPVRAALVASDALRQGRTRPLGIGRVSGDGVDRWFLANSGVGTDAAVLARMDLRRRRGGSASDPAYLRLAAAELARTALGGRWLRIVCPEAGPNHAIGASLVLVANLSPWTYLGARAVDPRPRAGVQSALAVYAATGPAPLAVGGMAVGLLAGGDLGRLPGTWAHGDLLGFEVACARPTWVHADGEVLAEVSRVRYVHVPDALTVVSAGP